MNIVVAWVKQTWADKDCLKYCSQCVENLNNFMTVPFEQSCISVTSAVTWQRNFIYKIEKEFQLLRGLRPPDLLPRLRPLDHTKDFHPRTIIVPQTLSICPLCQILNTPLSVHSILEANLVFSYWLEGASKALNLPQNHKKPPEPRMCSFPFTKS